MPAGRPPKSDEEKKRRGTFKPSRSFGDEITPTAAPTKKKRGRPRKNPITNNTLSLEAMKMYDSSVQTMSTYKMLTDLDIHHITMMCKEYDTYIKYANVSEIEFNPDTGLSVVSAQYKVRKSSLDMVIKLAEKLGISAVMRTRLRIKESGDEVDDPFQKLLKK